MIKRGDIYFIRDTRQSIGSEQKADRPAVIVSNDANNKHSGVYEVVYMTTQPKTDLPTHFITSSALRTSTVLCEQISSVYEERIGEWIGTLTPEEMKQLDECLTVSVGINTKAEKEPAEMESLRQQLAEMADRQQVAEKQAKTYKEMIDEKAVRSYNAMFKNELAYKTQSVIGWDLKPDILIHGSPCQDFSIAGHQGKATAAAGRINKGKGADEGSGTRSSLMWETIHIIQQMGDWKPRFVIWENVKNVTSKHMIHNFNRYLSEMQKLGYTNSFQTLDARDFGLPQARERVFTISVLNGEPFNFDDLIKTEMRDISEYLEKDVSEVYAVTQPSVYNAIGKKGIRRATVIKDYAYTITARQDRTPAQVIDLGGGKYRYLTERECWRLQGYSDADFEAAAAVQKKNGRYTMALYKQAGNSIPVTIFESIFRKIILGETAEKEASNE